MDEPWEASHAPCGEHSPIEVPEACLACRRILRKQRRDLEKIKRKEEAIIRSLGPGKRGWTGPH